jgi:hypothetical protein
MPRHAPLAALACAALLAAAPACERPAVAGRADEASSPAGGTYVPGLGEIMSLNQMRHLKLWLAGRDGNWALADYEIDELEEGFADAVRFHPHHKDAPRPLAELVPEFTRGPLDALRRATARHDEAAFTAAFDSLTEGCNGCHEAAGFGFNVVVRPTGNPYTNQRFRPSP